MNGYERINAALNGEWPDKRPVMLHNFMMAAKEAGFTQKEYREDPEKIAKAHIQAVEKYHYDGVLIDVDTATLAEAVGVPVDFPVEEPARTHGVMLKTLEEVDNLESPDISKNERIQIWLESGRLAKKYFGDEIYVRGNCDQAPFSLASMMRGPAEWMMDLLTGDPRVFDLLDFCTDATTQFIELMTETGVDMVSNGDSPAGPEMISAEMYREYALPYEKRIVQNAHDLNLPYCLHICGNTDIILDAMKESGMDAVELDYKTDIHKIYERFSKDLTFIGNIDPSGVIARGSVKDVEQKTRELLDIYKDSPRLIVNAGCAIPPDTPTENLRKMIEVARMG
jgi:uroporphyrinogen decarboxylase